MRSSSETTWPPRSRVHTPRGAEHVFLIGASMGGAAIMQNGAGLPVAGVVSLSGTRLWPGFGLNKPGSRALEAPLLHIGGRDDSRAPLEEARVVVAHAGSRDKRSVLYPGALRGWQLVGDTPPGPKTRALICPGTATNRRP